MIKMFTHSQLTGYLFDPKKIWSYKNDDIYVGTSSDGTLATIVSGEESCSATSSSGSIYL